MNLWSRGVSCVFVLVIREQVPLGAKTFVFSLKVIGAVSSIVCSGVCAYVCVCVVRANRARDGAQLAIRARRGMRAA
ncbi:unnamed protein product [Arctia plantaginis]|uniref:Uncharacterized protein n=1 Tax=Arctia plantaginis TaxID=874455 RepID=A0A8S1AL29_ARCPL|nr:unnamed protein product [Arctia plantaginis]